MAKLVFLVACMPSVMMKVTAMRFVNMHSVLPEEERVKVERQLHLLQHGMKTTKRETKREKEQVENLLKPTAPKEGPGLLRRAVEPRVVERKPRSSSLKSPPIGFLGAGWGRGAGERSFSDEGPMNADELKSKREKQCEDLQDEKTVVAGLDNMEDDVTESDLKSWAGSKGFDVSSLRSSTSWGSLRDGVISLYGTTSLSEDDDDSDDTERGSDELGDWISEDSLFDISDVDEGDDKYDDSSGLEETDDTTPFPSPVKKNSFALESFQGLETADESEIDCQASTPKVDHGKTFCRAETKRDESKSTWSAAKVPTRPESPKKPSGRPLGPKMMRALKKSEFDAELEAIKTAVTKEDFKKIEARRRQQNLLSKSQSAIEERNRARKVHRGMNQYRESLKKVEVASDWERILEMVDKYDAKVRDEDFSDSDSDADRTTALHLATIDGNVEAAKFIIEREEDQKKRIETVNSQHDVDFKTPLHYAVQLNRKEMVQLLLSHSAYLDARDIHGKTPLNYVSEVDPSYDGIRDFPLLHFAALFNAVQFGKVVRKHADRGGDIDLFAKVNGMTALDVARKAGSKRMQWWLEENDFSGALRDREIEGWRQRHPEPYKRKPPMIEVLPFDFDDLAGGIVDLPRTD